MQISRFEQFFYCLKPRNQGISSPARVRCGAVNAFVTLLFACVVSGSNQILIELRSRLLKLKGGELSPSIGFDG